MSSSSENSLSPVSPASEAGTVAVALAALLLGAVAMGVSPVFVRYAEVGPFTSAFYRVTLSLPLLALWAHLEAGGQAPARWDRATLLAGLFFAGDLVFWHLAIVNTTMANATFLATMAPVWVLLGSGLFIGEKVTRPMIAGLGLCLLGAGALVGSSVQMEPERLTGDIYGIITSIFFGAYFLAVRVARRKSRAGLILYRSTLVTAAALLVVALIMEDTFLPATWIGAAALVALAVISHTGGQGLLAYALGHLSAAFSSLVIFLEAVAAAFFGWLIFAETLSPLQIAGGGAILAGIWVARPRHRTTAPAVAADPATRP
ncbi:drug/metabolite transporter (DMT)-like permease [Breoghania corrubedonensis]|uniref:Drug/metabolite transporter (DMT)-like permease n=1 Tax=Breoghania corrubedonensis TaxID=665038 RepID=A0A2T5V6W0_9HYPH|nr:DMT family transporter [Breoghania corrubedonensis]PTW59493.1 drug/metabolite transporter (DMT)-like permease [Breoghania corrubedonensis]